MDGINHVYQDSFFIYKSDEALAVYLLRQTKEFKEAQLVRSRDPNLLSKCDVLVDVGGEFDPDRLRFDHHQVRKT